MSTIYLSQDGLTVHKNGGKILVKQQQELVYSLPKNNVNIIVVMANVQLSHAVIMDLLARNGLVVYLDRTGNVQGYLGRNIYRGENIVKQVLAYTNTDKRLDIAKFIVKNKITVQKDLLIKYNKHIKSAAIQKTVIKIKHFIKIIDNVADISKLMGIEGITAKDYYDCFPELLANSCFTWNGRNKRPPKDPVNAMLSFSYYLLERNIKLCLMKKGLISSIGFLHALDNYRESLVYDVMEVFRTLVAERFVLKCINLRKISLADFSFEEDSCVFTEAGRKKFVSAYEEFIADENIDGMDIDTSIKQMIDNIKEKF